ncbi:magnesium/cobalt transporter CorA [Rothia uropygialis]|uniref:magnesium/cobalt transporter CorA n=1 Tax=Kocuria sp. 36 TaxID=1415402 RepID=UPI00101BF37F|nr:magnesium/cobalt transporter CorA [Kocuria sp. 36]
MAYLLHTLIDSSEQTHPQDSAEAAIAELSTSPGSSACLVIEDPSDEELKRLAESLDLHPLAVEDASHGHQRPKLERYGEALFLAVHPISYTDRTEKLSISEIHAFIGPNYFLVTIPEGGASQLVLNQMRRAFKRQHLEPHNPQTLLYFLLDGVVDEYEPILMDLEEDLDEIEEELFTGSNSSQRIYELFKEVVKFQRGTRPLSYLLDLLMRGAEKYETPKQLHPHFRDVKDHVLRALEHLDSLRSALQNALTVDSTLVGQRQNDAMKRLSSWAAILAVPTVIAGIYGMNFEVMPELKWTVGYPLVLGLMALICGTLYLVFKKKNWM